MKSMESRCVEAEIEAMCLDRLKVSFDDYQNKLNLACGADYKDGDGWFNIDSDTNVKADEYCDLEKELPLPSEAFDLVYASHILEHIHNLQGLKAEIYRVLKPGGVLVTIVPHFKSDDAWGNPTHCRAFSLDSFRISQFWPGEYDPNLIMGYLKGGEKEDNYECKWILCKRTKVK